MHAGYSLDLPNLLDDLDTDFPAFFLLPFLGCLAEPLHNLIWELRESLGQTFVIVTHNPELYERADRVVTLREGRAVEPDATGTG